MKLDQQVVVRLSPEQVLRQRAEQESRERREGIDRRLEETRLREEKEAADKAAFLTKIESEIHEALRRLEARGWPSGRLIDVLEWDGSFARTWRRSSSSPIRLFRKTAVSETREFAAWTVRTGRNSEPFELLSDGRLAVRGGFSLKDGTFNLYERDHVRVRTYFADDKTIKELLVRFPAQNLATLLESIKALGLG